MLEIKNLYKTFAPGTVNEKRVINDLSLTLDDGDYVFTADPANVFIAPQTDSDRWVKVVITDADVI